MIEYGDADTLTLAQGRVLLDALVALAERNPQFFLGHAPRASVLIQSSLLDEVLGLLTERNDDDTAFRCPWALRTVLAQQIKGPRLVAQLRDELLAMAMDERQEFAIRADIGDHSLSMAICRTGPGCWRRCGAEQRRIPPA